MPDLGRRGYVPPEVDAIDLIHGKEDAHVMRVIHASAFHLHERLSPTDFDAGRRPYRNEDRLGQIATITIRSKRFTVNCDIDSIVPLVKLDLRRLGLNLDDKQT